jgi:hypothetical protein
VSVTDAISVLRTLSAKVAGTSHTTTSQAGNLTELIFYQRFANLPIVSARER